MKKVQINVEVKNRIGSHNYTTLPGTKNENILCALIVVLGNKDFPFTATDFLVWYNWLVGTLYQGIIIDFSKQPDITGTKLLEDAILMQGDETENLILRESFMKISKFIFEDDEIFLKELDSAYTDFEVSLLLFSFSPNCSV